MPLVSSAAAPVAGTNNVCTSDELLIKGASDGAGGVASGLLSANLDLFCTPACNL